MIFLHHIKRDNGTGGFVSIVGEAFVDGAAIVTRKHKQRIFKLKLMCGGDDTLPAWIGHLEPRETLVSMSEVCLDFCEDDWYVKMLTSPTWRAKCEGTQRFVKRCRGPSPKSAPTTTATCAA